MGNGECGELAESPARAARDGVQVAESPARAARDRVQVVRLLLAEDDDDDYFLTCEALQQNRLRNEVKRVNDGEELMRYLRHEDEFKDESAVEPSLILLDLNMPRKDGREALKEIKSDPNLKHIPVVVLTTSRAEEDVVRSYQLGVNSFITKPVTFQGLVEAMKALGQYWFEVVELPA